MKRFVRAVVREISIVWMGAKLDALSRREQEVFNSGAQTPTHVSSELLDQIEQMSRAIDDITKQIELIHQSLSAGREVS